MKEWFSFKGRSGRLSYFLRDLVEIVILLAAVILQVVVSHPVTVAIYLVVLVFIIWIGLASSVKRCHDLDKSGWWCLVPIWNVVALCFFKGTEGENRYGTPSTKKRD